MSAEQRDVAILGSSRAVDVVGGDADRDAGHPGRNRELTLGRLALKLNATPCLLHGGRAQRDSRPGGA